MKRKKKLVERRGTKEKCIFLFLRLSFSRDEIRTINEHREERKFLNDIFPCFF